MSPVEARDRAVLQVRERVVVGGRVGPRRRPTAWRSSRVAPAPATRTAWLAVGQRVADLDARRRAVDVLQGGGVPVEQERLVVVVHREGAARLEVALDRLHRFLGEEVVLQPQAALAGEQGERVGQGEHDEVVLARVALDEGPTVADVHGHPRVLVRVAGVVLRSQRLDDGVDLDGVDVLGPVGEGDGDVVAVAGADHEHPVGRTRQVAVREGVERLQVEQRRRRRRPSGAGCCWPRSSACRGPRCRRPPALAARTAVTL